MNGEINTDNRNDLAKIKPNTLRAYVAAYGWRKVEPYGDFGEVYTLDSGTVEIIIPTSSHLADYSIRLEQIVKILANTENRDHEAILRDLSMADVNLVRVRLANTSLDGSIPIDTAASAIDHSRKMLLAAACSTSHPSRAFKSGMKKERVRDYISTVRVGQTERGSFVINLISPIPAIYQPQIVQNMEDEPFPQRVIHKLNSGLQATRKAVDHAVWESDFVMFEEGVDAGVSANLCEAISGILGRGNENRIEISIRWALTGNLSGKRSKIIFDEFDTSALEEASRILRVNPPLADTRIEGYVSSLIRHKSDYQGLAKIEIEEVVNNSKRSIWAEFCPEDYDRIIEAHAHKRTVSVRGELRQEGKGQRWTLIDPHDLVIIGPERQTEKLL